MEHDVRRIAERDGLPADEATIAKETEIVGRCAACDLSALVALDPIANVDDDGERAVLFGRPRDGDVGLERVQRRQIRHGFERRARENTSDEAREVVRALERFDRQGLEGAIGRGESDAVEALDAARVEATFGIDREPRVVGEEEHAEGFALRVEIPHAEGVIPARRHDEAALGEERGAEDFVFVREPRDLGALLVEERDDVVAREAARRGEEALRAGSNATDCTLSPSRRRKIGPPVFASISTTSLP